MIEVFLNPVKPLIDQRIEQRFLLYLQIMSCAVKHGKRATRIVFQIFPGIAVARRRMLATDQYQRRFFNPNSLIWA